MIPLAWAIAWLGRCGPRLSGIASILDPLPKITTMAVNSTPASKTDPPLCSDQPLWVLVSAQDGGQGTLPAAYNKLDSSRLSSWDESYWNQPTTSTNQIYPHVAGGFAGTQRHRHVDNGRVRGGRGFQGRLSASLLPPCARQHRTRRT